MEVEAGLDERYRLRGDGGRNGVFDESNVIVWSGWDGEGERIEQGGC